MTERTDIDVDALRARLVDHRDELLAHAGATEEARKPVVVDQASVGRLSRMDAMQGHALAVETGRRRDIELKRVEAALKRVDEGEYGYCVACGVDIPSKRLELDPAVPTCIDCASVTEEHH